MEELCAQKLHNFKQRFLPELMNAGFSDEEIARVTWQSVCTHLVLAGPLFRRAVDDKDMQQVVDIATVLDSERAMRVWETWGGMTKDKQDVFWRYAKFFFQSVLGDP